MLLPRDRTTGLAKWALVNQVSQCVFGVSIIHSFQVIKSVAFDEHMLSLTEKRVFNLDEVFMSFLLTRVTIDMERIEKNL